MAIFIFEDNIIQGEQLKRIIQILCQQENISCNSLLLTHRSTSLLNQIAEENNIYFLDIDIHGKRYEGFELAKIIRKRDQQGIIVFITVHSNFAPISYGYMVSALNFIDKTLPVHQLCEEVKKCLVIYADQAKNECAEDYLYIENRTAATKLPTQEIILFEVIGPHKIEATTRHRKIIFSSNLKKLENIKPDLIKCHQSFIVNIQHIIEFDKQNSLLTMTNNRKVPVSKRQYSFVKKVLIAEKRI